MDMFIDGRWTPAVSGAAQNVTNPTTGAVIDTVPTGDAIDADIAIQAAHRAFQTWRAVPVAERAHLQRKAASTMRARAAELGRVLTSELGRPLAGAITEIERASDLLDVYADEGLRIHAEIISSAAGEKVFVTREPLGVVVAITPFNYPINLLIFKLGAALIAGCTVVAKPAEDTPLSTLMLAEIFFEAGFPAGCFNVVTGHGRGIGMAMVNHRIPAKVAFTGGTAAGKAIAAAAAGTVKRVTLELGGQSPAIICADADFANAAVAIARHGFANSGQFCYRVNRVYVERPAYEKFLSALLAEVAKITVGDGQTQPVTMGPMVNEKIFGNAANQIVDARAKGARICSGGERLKGGIYDQGFFLPPTVIADADHSMLIMTEETFGPVLGVMPVESPAQALNLANDTDYGLAGFVFSGDTGRGFALAERINAGSVWVNNIHRSHHTAPFGGMKQSGIGREKGRWGVESYLEYKTIYLTYDEGLE
jgi:succinate-semialdehyde dehydrogenase / glutarate-semialdehyde dehydrogenase